MGTWGEVLQDLRALQKSDEEDPHGRLIREAAARLSKYTGRDTIVYATAHLQNPQASANLTSIVHEDLQGFMECVYGLDGDQLDLVLHSSGGVPEAADSIVQYLRSKFTNIRVLVPQMAMSAATMMACAANRIVLGKHSSLGPIDPQFVMQTELGMRLVPAQTVLEQFDRAKEECDDERTLSVWYPILKQYGPALLVECRNAIRRSQVLVKQWLEENMFAGQDDAEQRADSIARKLAAHGVHLTHGRPLGKDYLKSLGLVVDDLEADQTLQDRVLTLYHSLMIVFDQTRAAKIIMNQQGRNWLKLQGVGVLGAGAEQPEGDQAANGGERKGCLGWLPWV